MSGPPLSVIMPAFNAGPYLEPAVASIRAQTFADFEFIIVDDGSTDATPSHLARHAGADPRIKVIRQENRGIVDALNSALAAASGVLIARMDADDIALPHRFERQAQALARQPDTVAIGSACEEIDADGKPLRRRQMPTEPDQIRSTLQRTNCMAHPTVMMRREAVMRVGGYRGAFLYCEDYDLWLRMLDIGALRNLPDVLLRYRVYSGKRSAAFIEQQVLSEIGARACAARRKAGQPDLPDGVTRITRETLAGLGVAHGAIDRQVMRRALQNARHMAAIGDRESYRALVDLARRQQHAGLGDRFDYWLLRLKAATRRGPHGPAQGAAR